MCNRRHDDGVPIKKSGSGWKIFENSHHSIDDATHKEGDIYAMVKRHRIFFDVDGIVRYKREQGGWEDGFCFFLKKKEAERCLKGWLANTSYRINQCVLKKIHYYEGIERHQEKKICDGRKYEIALCKSYRILEMTDDN